MATASAPLPSANGSPLLADRNCAAGHIDSVFLRKSPTPTDPEAANPQTKPHEESLLASLCSFIEENQIGLSVNLIALLFLTHNFFPRARRRTSKFFHLSYYNPDSEQYGCGTDDLFFVALCVVVFTGLRVFAMDYVLEPLARLGGIGGGKALVRFKEQAWLAVYCACSWSLGMHLIYKSEHALDIHAVWNGWPFREIDALTKWYYLVQWGFWLQQIVVVNIEQKRKDYGMVLAHHGFTCALIFLSYGYYHTRVGTVILATMDLADILLPAAKILKYLGHSSACDAVFGVFMLSWVATRHVLFILVCWSVYAHAPIDIAPGCYLADGTMVPASSTEHYNALGGNEIWTNLVHAYTHRDGAVCSNPTIRFSFLGLLLAIQALCIVWFATIAAIAYDVLAGKGAVDARSEEGEESEIEEELKPSHANGSDKSSYDFAAPLEQEVGVESLTFPRKSSPGVKSYRRASNRTGGRSSGISIPGHGDRKELLGRIGCDKPS
ncbi:longevity assurance proteins LAG1/LAC1 [Polyplosphaeria fusca]|uniref:Longevity assurance proteins LAG1/LAC1 n=1 Tax=Polyplosphaeria fusca TaxID=682080 RepID=A0A9P4QLM5_9PLEO|nr:longevity assurance proteins LAG1/LAC1 [Polyplosphaeria fusca]